MIALTDKQIEAKYQAELVQTDKDHHQPTAGAMTGHIVANLWVLDVTFHQALWYAKGPDAIALQPLYRDLIATTRQQLDELGAVLLDENELPPATTAEFAQYAKIDEDPRLKYRSASAFADNTAQLLTMANLFIDRAIALATREKRPVLAATLTTMRGTNNRAIRQFQNFLGKTAWEDLVAADDDDDD